MTPLGAVHAASAEDRMRSERSKGRVELYILLDSRLIDHGTVFEEVFQFAARAAHAMPSGS
jgi:hypothetical protein